MPPIKNSPHKTGKSMLFFTFEMTLFSVMSINSQIYMTKPKQARKTLSENTGKTFSVIMPPFSSKGGHNYGNDCTNNKTTSLGRSNWNEVRIMWKDPFWVKVFLLKLFAFRAYKSKSCRKQNVFDPSHIFHTLPLLHHSLQVQALKYSISDTQCWNRGSPWQAPWEPWPSSLWWRCGGSQRCSALRRSCRPVTEHC